MQAIVDLIGTGRLDVSSLISHRFAFDEAIEAYEALTGDPSALGIVLEYAGEPVTDDERRQPPRERELVVAEPSLGPRVGAGGRARLAVIGSGSYANNTLLPALRAIDADVVALVGGGGGAAATAQRFGIARVVGSADAIWEDDDVDAVLVVTRHDSHAALVVAALDAGKAVFVEKPLSVDLAGLEAVVEAYARSRSDGRPPIVGIGFNRRFSPITQRMVELLSGVPLPKFVIITVNAGQMPSDHWTLAPTVGGGRIIGEACHFIDLARHLVASPITSVSSVELGAAGTRDSVTITLRHDDGSVSNVNYLTNGAKRYPKESVTVFAGGRVLVNENFRALHAYGFGRTRPVRLLRQDKGHREGLQAFIAAVKEQRAYPIPFSEVVEVTRASLDAARPG